METKYYDFDWDKVKTIKDLKLIMALVASKLVINHSDPIDAEVYENMKDFLVEVDGE